MSSQWLSPQAVWRLALAAVAGMIAYPPWCLRLQDQRETMGYDFVFAPPDSFFEVDLTRLLLQVFAVVCVALVVSGFRLPGRRAGSHQPGMPNE